MIAIMPILETLFWNSALLLEDGEKSSIQTFDQEMSILSANHHQAAYPLVLAVLLTLSAALIFRTSGPDLHRRYWSCLWQRLCGSPRLLCNKHFREMGRST